MLNQQSIKSRIIKMAAYRLMMREKHQDITNTKWDNPMMASTEAKCDAHEILLLRLKHHEGSM